MDCGRSKRIKGLEERDRRGRQIEERARGKKEGVSVGSEGVDVREGEG